MAIKKLAAAGMVCYLAMSPTFATITVDGNTSDWAGIPALITDPPGDHTLYVAPDMLGLRVADDGINIYLLYEFANDPSGGAFLHIDSDRTAATGCAKFGLGFEFGLTFGFSSYIGDARDCAFGMADYPGALKAVFAPTWVEASFPISVLETMTPGLDAFDIKAMNDESALATYYFGSTGSAPEPSTLALLGLGLAGLAAARRRKQ